MKIHQGHQGIQCCRGRAQATVWWLKMSSQIREMVQTCPDCTKYLSPPREPMISSIPLDYRWQKVGSDLIQLHGHTYLLVVDYFSRYPEGVVKLTSTTSQSIIKSFLHLHPTWNYKRTHMRQWSTILSSDIVSATPPPAPIIPKEMA